MSSFIVSYCDLIKFPYFADTSERWWKLPLKKNMSSSKMIMTLWFKTSSSKEEEKEPKVKRAQEESCTMCLSVSWAFEKPLEVINSYEGLGIPLYPPTFSQLLPLGLLCFFFFLSFFFHPWKSSWFPNLVLPCLSMMNQIHGLFRNRSSILP